MLDLMIALPLALGVKPAALGFARQLVRVRAGANLGEHLPHHVLRFGGDDARSAAVVAVLGGVADRVAHEAEAAAIHQIDDQLQLVQALEVGDLRLIPCLDQRFETGGDERADAAAEHRLLAEQIRFRFFREVVSITPARVQPMPLA